MIEQRSWKLRAGICAIVPLLCACAGAQQSGSPPVVQSQPAAIDSNAPVVITLLDALRRARNLDTTYRTALTAAGIAHEEHVQARAGLLPSVTYNNEYLYTQGNGTSTPRYIANNAVHEYVSQANAHEQLSVGQFADLSRTTAAEAAARANAEVATRGLVATVVKTYYAEIVARRKYANAQLAADEAQRFFDLSQKLEQGGEVAHSDVIKAQLQANDAKRALREAELEMNRSHIELALLVFPDFNQNYSTVDDLRLPRPYPRCKKWSNKRRAGIHSFIQPCRHYVRRDMKCAYRKPHTCPHYRWTTSTESMLRSSPCTRSRRKVRSAISGIRQLQP